MTDNEKEPCDCYEPDCEECNQRVVDQEDEEETGRQIRSIEEQEERIFQRELEGGDDDDWDEDDLHGSHPIDEPNEEE